MPTVPLCLLFLCAYCSFVPTVPLCPLLLQVRPVPTVPLCPLFLQVCYFLVRDVTGESYTAHKPNFRHYTTRSCLVISVKTIVNFVPLKKSYLETFNQYLKNILNSHSMQSLKLSVRNIEENITSRAAIFRLQRDESSA